MRKRILGAGGTRERPAEIDVASIAVVHVTSESEDGPVENAFDARRGRGGSRWIAGGTGEQTILLEFDRPQSIASVTLEIEETEETRTQELTLDISRDGGATYRPVVRQEFNFSPPGTTFEREEWRLQAQDVTHLRLWIKPDKGGAPARAKVTSLSLL